MTQAKLVIIGIDGADWRVIDDLCARAALPNLARLIEGGLRAELGSTPIAATLPAWSSFLCAAEPASHGVVDMFVHKETPGGKRSYDLSPATSTSHLCPTFLGDLARAGLKVASLGVPATYPPDPALDLCVAGFDSPGASGATSKAVSPASFYRDVRRLGGWRYAVFNEQRGGDKRLAAIAPALLMDLDAKERVILSAYARAPWDVFFVHQQASDTAGHHLWHTYDRASPRFRGGYLEDALPSVYRRIDALIGALLSRVPASARTLVVSDHGMGPASDTAVYINRVLFELGVLRFNTRHQGLRRGAARGLSLLAKRLTPARLALARRLLPDALAARLLGVMRQRNIDFRASAAFSDELDYGPSVWINRREVFTHGEVLERDAKALALRLRERLLDLRHPRSGAPLLRAVHHRDEVFSGPYAELAPDLILVPDPSSRPSFLPSPGPGPVMRLLEEHEFSAGRGAGMPGVHRHEGVFIAHGPGLEAGRAPKLDLAHAGALVYTMAARAAPERALARLPVFWRELAARLAGDAPPLTSVAQEATPAYSEAEQAIVLQRLRDLGYVD